MSGFIVYSLPRSRTAWLSRFLTYGDWACSHEEMRHARSLDDVRAWFSQPFTGTVETAGAPWWRLVQKMAPGIRTVVVRRPVAEVVDSLNRIGMDGAALAGRICHIDAKLAQIESRVPGVLSVQARDLARQDVCASVFEHCLQQPHDPAWWAAISPVNIQISMPLLVRYCAAHRPQMEKLAGQAKQLLISDMSRRPLQDPDGITFQQERFADWYRDATPLFKDHMVQTDQAVEDYTRKNIPLLQTLDDLGFMQITTVRSNGRMFGYVMAVLCPSLDDPDVLSAMHLPFFVSRDAPGVGLKLQRASIAGLKERRAGELFLRAGVRGDGPRLGSLYRRLGAEDYGRLYRLDMAEA